ncbi:uncharacterized protein HaLaN_01595, partial [Haematococcus lacustris]
MKEGSLLLDMREWLQLLTDTGLFHKHFGTREAKLAFVWARLRHIRESNDLRAYQRVRSLTFREFLEALGRVADMMSLPPEAELRLAGCDGEKPTAQYYTSHAVAHGFLAARPSAAHCAPKTRPLDVKLEQLLEVVLSRLMGLHNALTVDNLVLKLRLGRGRGVPHLGSGSM